MNDYRKLRYQARRLHYGGRRALQGERLDEFSLSRTPPASGDMDDRKLDKLAHKYSVIARDMNPEEKAAAINLAWAEEQVAKMDRRHSRKQRRRAIRRHLLYNLAGAVVGVGTGYSAGMAAHGLSIADLADPKNSKKLLRWVKAGSLAGQAGGFAKARQANRQDQARSDQEWSKKRAYHADRFRNMKR